MVADHSVERKTSFKPSSAVLRRHLYLRASCGMLPFGMDVNCRFASRGHDRLCFTGLSGAVVFHHFDDAHMRGEPPRLRSANGALHLLPKC